MSLKHLLARECIVHQHTQNYPSIGLYKCNECAFFSFCNSVKSPIPFYSHYKGFPGRGYIAALCTQTLAGLVLLISKYYGAYLQLVYTVTSHLKSMEL